MYHPPSLSLSNDSVSLPTWYPTSTLPTSPPRPLSLPRKSIAAHLMVFKMGAREPEFPVAPSALAVPVVVNSPYKK